MHKYEEFLVLKNYCESDSMKLYQLSCSIADLFDQYMVFRPNMVKAWRIVAFMLTAIFFQSFICVNLDFLVEQEGQKNVL